jgi:DNA-binding NarL/FixJ family response regulator
VPQSVLLADGNERLADVMAQLLADEPGFRVVGIAHTCEQAVELARQHVPDVVLVSEEVGGVPGVQVCAALRSVVRDATLLMWSHDVSRGQVLPPVDGTLERGSSFRELVRSLRKVRRIDLSDSGLARRIRAGRAPSTSS